MEILQTDGLMNYWPGSCHCKNIELEFFSGKKPSELWVRKCSCDFCIKQGNYNVADPEGKLRVRIRDHKDTIYYQMGHKTSDRLICKICGVYIGGFMKHSGKSVCILNLNVLEQLELFASPTPINISSQTFDERIAGRLIRWMPFEMLNDKKS
jgi:hypothetical protein